MREGGPRRRRVGCCSAIGSAALDRCAAALLAATVSGCAAEGGTAEAGTEASASGAAASASGETTWQPADAVCGQFEAEAAERQGAVVYFWMCRHDCGLYGLGSGDTFGDEVAQAQRSYEALDPGSECHLLRTALYECFSALTCSDVHAWSDALESPQEGPCEPEYRAISPKIEACGI